MRVTSVAFKEITCDVASPKLLLICFPYGGGDWSAYSFLHKLSSSGIKVIGISLPGRANRIVEDYIVSTDDLVADIISFLDSIKLPFAFLGHSFGSGLALQVANELYTLGNVLPSVLLLSGRMPPHCGYIDLLSQDNGRYLHRYICSSNIIDISSSDKIIHDFISYQSKVITSDLELNSQLSYCYSNKLPVKINILNGNEDEFLDYSRLIEWSRYSTKQVSFDFYHGNHFYFKEHYNLVFMKIREILLTI